MSGSLVDLCQHQSFLQDDLLLDKLSQSGASGLEAAVDVRAFFNQNTNVPESDEGSLEVVIIIAIVIACVAFMFLVFAIYWAWRYDKKNRDAYLTNKATTDDDRTFEAADSPEGKDMRGAGKRADDQAQAIVRSYPSVIGGDSAADGVYPESVISEDINSSITQYYQSGLQNYNGNGGRLQDAGSVSSMESYGYSLDGYAPSMATPMPADGVSTSMAMSVGGDTSTTALSQTVESTPASKGDKQKKQHS